MKGKNLPSFLDQKVSGSNLNPVIIFLSIWIRNKKNFCSEAAAAKNFFQSLGYQVDTKTCSDRFFLAARKKKEKNVERKVLIWKEKNCRQSQNIDICRRHCRRRCCGRRRLCRHWHVFVVIVVALTLSFLLSPFLKHLFISIFQMVAVTIKGWNPFSQMTGCSDLPLHGGEPLSIKLLNTSLSSVSHWALGSKFSSNFKFFFCFLLPYLALTLVLPQMGWLGIIIFFLTLVC